MTLKESIISNLSQYEYINKLLGNAIRKRLAIRGYTRGMLTANLLDGGISKKDLESLEYVLQLGEKHCADFKYIFKERKLPNKDLAIDGEITNILAEVRAFEFLWQRGFRDICKIRRKPDTKIVDFTARKDNQNYAVEVTRLGLAQADRKKPRHIIEDDLIRYTVSEDNKLIGELVGKWFLTSGKENTPRIMEAIRDAIHNEYPQIKDFSKIQGSDWRGMLFISTGRDYFVMNKYARAEFEMHRNAVEEALKRVWDLFQEEREDFRYLHHTVIMIGKDLGKTIMYPEL